MAALRDTTPEARRIQLEILAKLGGPVRFEMACEMSEAARTVTEAGIRCRHPQWSDAEVHRALLEILVGSELARVIDATRLTRA
jgi:hypothetical protein